MSVLLADRMQKLGTETAFEMLSKAKQLEAEGKNIIHLEIGEPDFPTPRNIVDQGCKSMLAGMTKYTPSSGLYEVKQVIADYIGKTRGYTVDPDEVVITAGGKPIIFYSILAFVNPGDEVIYPNPGFPIYESVINFAGGIPVPIPLREENHFRMNIDELDLLITNKTKMIIINSPHNPTGGLLTRKDLEYIAQIAIDKDLIVLADEIYEKIVYDQEFYSITSYPGMKEKTIILNGLSKTYAMTGWRMGYGVMPKDVAIHIAKLVTNSTSCLAGFTQMACIEALTGSQEEVKKRVEQFKIRRDLIVEGLNSIPGIKCLKPDGTFYVFPNVKELGKTSNEIADYLLYEAGVATLSGSSFGIHGEGYLRISYANSLENIKIALKRIKEALSKL